MRKLQVVVALLLAVAFAFGACARKEASPTTPPAPAPQAKPAPALTGWEGIVEALKDQALHVRVVPLRRPVGQHARAQAVAEYEDVPETLTRQDLDGSVDVLHRVIEDAHAGDLAGEGEPCVDRHRAEAVFEKGVR